MSAIFVSLLILVSSAAVVFLWLRSATQALLSRGFEQDDSAEVTRALRFEYPAVRQRLENPDQVGDCDDPLELLERDYKALTYLLRQTGSHPAGGYSTSERLLLLDYKLLRLSVRVKWLLAVNNWRSSLREIATILEYFGKVVGQRLRCSMMLLEPRLATAEGPPSALLGMCSYCRKVRFPTGSSGGQWVTPKRYRQLGGQGRVALSHGICPHCLENLVKPMSPRP